MNRLNDPSHETALVKDALEFVNLVRKDTRENFMLGAQSMGYFLEDTGSASDMARQLIKLAIENAGPVYETLKEYRTLDYDDIGSIIQITKGPSAGKTAIVDSIGGIGVTAHFEGAEPNPDFLLEVEFGEFTVISKRKGKQEEIKM